MLSRISSEYQDHCGNRLSVRLERHQFLYRVYAHHSRDGNGATSEHAQEKLARSAFRALEAKVVAQGWKLKECVAMDRQPSPMLLDDDGNRMFRDAVTGEYRPDDSAFRPSPGAVFFTVKDGPQPDAFAAVFAPKDQRATQ
jgi:hypothetical protein